MVRWEPNTRERLVRVALDLFAEHGYDATTVNQIAVRAGLTKTTFFRHFADKREVLFAGQDIHNQTVADAIDAAPDGATPLQTVGLALDALAALFTDDRRELGARVREVIAGNEDLQERATYKRATLAAALVFSLMDRGVTEPGAGLAAELGVRAYYQAFGEWTTPGNEESLGTLVQRAFTELRAAVAALD